MIISVHSPQLVHFGDSAEISLVLEPIDDSPYSTLQSDSLNATEDAVIENADINIVSTARLDLPYSEVVPGGIITEPMSLHVPANYSWVVQPSKPGLTSGKLWVYIEINPTGEKDLHEMPILVRDIEVTSKLLFSVSPNRLRPVFILGILAGFILIWIKVHRASNS